MFHSEHQTQSIFTTLLVLVVFFGTLQRTQPADNQGKPEANAPSDRGETQEIIREITLRIAYCSSQGNLAGEKIARQELASLLRQKYGADHWRTVAANCYLESVLRTCNLSADKQKQIAKARDLCVQTERHQQAGNLQSALSSSKEALEIYRDVMGESDMVFVTILMRVGTLQQSLGMYKDSEVSLSRSLELRTRLVGNETPDNAPLMNNLANVYLELDRFEDAEKQLVQALKIYQKNESGTVAHGVAYINLARTYNLKGNFRPAESAARESNRILGRMLPQRYPYYIKSQLELARSYMGQKEYADAVAVYERVLNIFGTLKTNPPPSLMHAEVLDGYAVALRAIGNNDGAEENAAKAARLRAQASNEVH